MTKPCIICVAITGSLPKKADNPAVPITVSEQVESTHEAFEAGAIAYLFNIDDSQIDHMVYPKDLVAYARNFSSSPNSTQTGRIESGQPCPKAGYWFTPAQANSRRAFKQGEIMPAFDGSRWGATLWYWSGEDDA